MENKELKFKTSLQCGGCVSKIKDTFDKHTAIENWNVDTEHADKILSVTSKGISAEEIMEIVKSKGFTIEVLN